MMKQIPKSGISRRRFIVSAGVVGTMAVLTGSAAATKAVLRPITWTGSALGAEASIQLYHDDPEWAKQQLNRCQSEIIRLERLFSLYKPNSAISRLNAQGYLDDPDIEFLELMSLAMSFTQQSDGLFDVTVQPLWKLYVDHFSKGNANPAGPAHEEITDALKYVGSQHIHITPRRIAFQKPGMAATFNGIAQGYITDRVAALLRAAGFTNVLVSLGENHALGGKPDGTPWRVGIVSPKDGSTITTKVDLMNKALATSGGYGSPFSPNSRANHLLNPLTGGCAEFERSVTVISNSATQADMASTALSMLPTDQGRELASRLPFIDRVIYET